MLNFKLKKNRNHYLFPLQVSLNKARTKKKDILLKFLDLEPKVIK